MAKDTMAKAVVKVVASTIAAVASIGAIAGGGWYAAVEYYHLNGKVSAIYTSAKVQEQSLEIADLRAKLAEKDKTITVAGRAKPARSGRVKTSHLEERLICGKPHLVHGGPECMAYGESAQDGGSSIHSSTSFAGLVPASDCPRAGHRS